MKNRRKSGYGMDVQVSRRSGAVMMTEDEQRELEDASRGDHNIFGNKNKDVKYVKTLGSPKPFDIVDFVSDWRKDDAAGPVQRKEPKKQESHINPDRLALMEQYTVTKGREHHYHGASYNFTRNDTRPSKRKSCIDPVLAAKPAACLGAIFAAARKNVASASPNHYSHGEWQQTSFPLCPHIQMRLFWTTEDPSNKQAEWVFDATPVIGNKIEHEACKGKIKGIHINADRLGDKVRKQMDRMRLRGPANIGRVIRQMPSFLATDEVETLQDTDRNKAKKNEAALFKEKVGVEAKKRKRQEDEEALEKANAERTKKKAKKDTMRKGTAATPVKAGGPTTAMLEGDAARERQALPKTPAMMIQDKISGSTGGAKESTKKHAEKKTRASTKKKLDQKKYQLSEEFVYDSEEGFSGDESRKQQPDKDLTVDPSNMSKSTTKTPSKRKASELDTQQPSKKSKTTLEATSESNVPSLDKTRNSQIVQSAPKKRKASESAESPEVTAQQPVLKKRKALLEDKELKEAESNVATHLDPETAIIAESAPSKKRKASHDEGSNEDSSIKKAKTSASEETVVTEASEEGEASIEHSPKASEITEEPGLPAAGPVTASNALEGTTQQEPKEADTVPPTDRSTVGEDSTDH